MKSFDSQAHGSEHAFSRVYEAISDRFIQSLKRGHVPWHTYWPREFLARNYMTGETYKGINVLFTRLSPKPLPYFVTMEQIKEIEGELRPGAIPIPIMFQKALVLDKNDSVLPLKGGLQQKGSSLCFALRVFDVYSIHDVAKATFTLPAPPQLPPALTLCVKALDSMRNLPPIQEHGQNTMYHPMADIIQMPKSSPRDDAYYGTLFRLIIHATGHGKRLNRPGIHDSSSENLMLAPYETEALIGEIGTLFLCSAVGLRPVIDPNHRTTKYKKTWIRKITKNPTVVLEAALKAKEAVDYLIG